MVEEFARGTRVHHVSAVRARARPDVEKEPWSLADLRDDGVGEQGRFQPGAATGRAGDVDLLPEPVQYHLLRGVGQLTPGGGGAEPGRRRPPLRAAG